MTGSLLLLPWLLDLIAPRIWEDSLLVVVRAVLVRISRVAGLLMISLWVMRRSNLWVVMGPLMRRSALKDARWLHHEYPKLGHL